MLPKNVGANSVRPCGAAVVDCRRRERPPGRSVFTAVRRFVVFRSWAINPLRHCGASGTMLPTDADDFGAVHKDTRGLCIKRRGPSAEPYLTPPTRGVPTAAGVLPKM